MKPAQVLRRLKTHKATQFLRRAEDAKRRAHGSEGADRLVQLRRMEDFQKLAEAAEQ